ncbi:MAG: hypothetical protein F4X54_04110 [Chloroflexi bacterium]|nr:hypothetical protein [Chloroflexota bacterium]
MSNFRRRSIILAVAGVLVLAASITVANVVFASLTAVSYTVTRTTIEAAVTDNGATGLSAQLRLGGEDAQECRVVYNANTIPAETRTTTVLWTGLNQETTYTIDWYSRNTCTAGAAQTDVVTTGGVEAPTPTPQLATPIVEDQSVTATTITVTFRDATKVPASTRLTLGTVPVDEDCHRLFAGGGSSTSTESETWSNLVPNTTYTVRIYASADCTGNDTTGNVRTLPPATPTPTPRPTEPTPTPQITIQRVIDQTVTTTTISATFTGSATTSVLLTLGTVPVDENCYSLAGAGDKTRMWENLVPNTTYTLRIYASADCSGFSSTGTIRTLPDTPDPTATPTLVTPFIAAQSGTQTAITVTFQDATRVPASVSLTLGTTPVNPRCTALFITPGASATRQQTVTWSNLLPGTAYSVRVYASLDCSGPDTSGTVRTLSASGEPTPTPHADVFRIDDALIVSPVAEGTLMLAVIYTDLPVGEGEDAREETEQLRVSWRFGTGSDYVASSRLPLLYSRVERCFACDDVDGQGFNLVAAWVPNERTFTQQTVAQAVISEGATVQATRAVRLTNDEEEAGVEIKDAIAEIGGRWGVDLIAGDTFSRDGMYALRTILPQVTDLGLGITSEQIELQITDDAPVVEPEGVDLPPLITDPLEGTSEQLGIALGSTMLLFGLILIGATWVLVSKTSSPIVALGIICGGVIPLVVVSGILGIFGYLIIAGAATVALARTIREHVPAG